MEMLSKLALAFEHGGIWMWPIAAFQVVSLAIIVERVFALYIRRKGGEKAFVGTLEDNIRRGEIDSVVEKSRASADRFAVARATVSGSQVALNFGGKDEIQGKMDEVLLHENSLLDNRVGFLAMLGNVATLTGLLGTITGMIKSFAAVAFANPSEKASLLAQGISEAMNATAYGLIVAIPALVAFAVLQNRANHLADDMNQAALKVFNWLSFSFDPVSMRAHTGSRQKPKSADVREVNA